MALAPVIPQPSKSNSRSNRVIEELQESLEQLQKDVLNTKSQLETIQESKQKNEKDGQEYVKSNQECRAQIQELMEILESKQQSFDSTKKESVDLEAKVKQLKDEALLSRERLDKLKKSEAQLGKDRDEAVLAKDHVKYQSVALNEALKNLDKRYEKEQLLLKKELSFIRYQLKQSIHRNEILSNILDNEMKNEAETRKQLAEQLKEQQKEQDKVNELIVERVQKELDNLITDINHHVNNSTKDIENQIQQSQDDVNGLVNRIKSYSLGFQ